MKKVVLLASLFLVGMTAQAFTNHQSDAISTPGKYNRYNNAQEISFVENGVLFTVTTNGYFHFKQLERRSPKDRFNRRDRRERNRNHQVVYRNGNQVRYVSNYRPQRLRILRDRFGYITQVGNTPIYYNKKGRVKHIGFVKMKYKKGRLVRLGNMNITYNRFGDIRDTFGYINRYNNFWHDDCNLENEDQWNHHHNNRRDGSEHDDDDHSHRREEELEHNKFLVG